MNAFSSLLWPAVFWAAILPAWLAFDYVCRPTLRRLFEGDKRRFLAASAVRWLPAWFTVLIMMGPPQSARDPSSLIWRLPLAIGAAIALAWLLGRWSVTARLQAAMRQAEVRVLEHEPLRSR